jgi:putative AlgH/UPF0301 family transcriptional regulator
MAALLIAAASVAFVDVRRLPMQSLGARRTTVPLLAERFDIDEAMGEMDKAVSREDYAEAARLKKLIDAQVAIDRAQLTRQLMGGAAESSAGAADDDEAPCVSRATTLAAGQVLVANPERFCSRNPFARPLMDMARFGIEGPVKVPGFPPDMIAQRLPVLLLLQHDEGGSRALLMEQRTGALMGDVSMEEYGPCAILPLWSGGTERQNSLYIIHDVSEAGTGSNEISDGLFQGGWDQLRPKVADYSVSEARIKFFVGATEWRPGQLQRELEGGAWLALDVPPSLVVKDRVSDWRPGQPKPVWTEMLKYLPSDDDAVAQLIEQIYGE